MDLFEYQGKQYFARFGIAVSPGDVADTVDEAVAVAERVGYPVVVKAQVKVGGRGKAGGVKLADDAERGASCTPATSSDWTSRATSCKRLWIERSSDIAKEYYASFTLDRQNKTHLGMLSAQGGVEIEVVAEENPDAIAFLSIDPVRGLDLETARRWVAEAELDEAAREQAAELLVQALRLLHQGRLRPRRDQPADPHAGQQGARARREGDARRERLVPPPRVGGVPRRRVRGPAREDGQGEGPQLHRPRRNGRHHRQRRGARDVARSTSSTRSAAPRRTSSTSAAAPTPTSWRRRSR